jgi:galactose mutarotase-like enzyme
MIRKKMRVFTLSSEELTVQVYPDEGARVASLRSLGSGLEFLTQSHRTGPYPAPRVDARFQDGPCSGIEECLPTVGPCVIEGTHRVVPDHGDFWQLSWEVTDSSHEHIQMQTRGFSTSIVFSKEIAVEGDTLRIRYQIENPTDEAVPYLYACHPLFAIDAGDRVLLSQDIESLTLYYSRNQRLGPAGSTISWPDAKAEIALDIAQAHETGIAEMLYTDRLSAGRCGLYRSTARQGLYLTFSPHALPYLGLWLCYGGWPESSSRPRQYAIALEPTTAPLNTLSQAESAGLALVLQPGKTAQWEIAFHITTPGTSLAEFQALLS